MSLVQRGQRELVKNDNLGSTIGTGLLVAGGGGIGLLFVAGMLPFISFPVLCVLLVIAGVALKL